MVSAEALLQLWEIGQRRAPADRAWRLLALALPDHDVEALARFDVALRDWRLLRTHAELFGPQLTGSADCPHCGEQLEIELDANAIGHGCPSEPPEYVARDGRRFRLPSIVDLLAVAADPDVERAARELFVRCSIDGLSSEDQSPALFDEVDAGLAALAEARSLSADVTCAICGRSATHVLDPAEFLW